MVSSNQIVVGDIQVDNNQQLEIADNKILVVALVMGLRDRNAVLGRDAHICYAVYKKDGYFYWGSDAVGHQWYTVEYTVVVDD